MKKAARIVFIIQLCLTIAFFMYLLHGYIHFDDIVINSTPSNSGSTSDSHAGNPGAEMFVWFTSWGVSYILLRILTLIGILLSFVAIFIMIIGTFISFRAKTKGDVTVIAVFNIVCGSLPAGVLLLASHPTEYEY